MTARRISLSLIPALSLLACGSKQAEPEPVVAAAAVTVDPDLETRTKAAAEVLASMDLTADPCSDFYRYACGGWLDATTRPADQASWSRSFSVIDERNREVLRALLEQAAADPGAGGDPTTAEGGDWARLGNYYGSCMDLQAVDAAGLEPIQPLLDAIAGMASSADLPGVLASLQASGTGALFSVERWGDLKNPDANSAYLGQGGLGLPDRDYYLKDDEASVALQAAYRVHIAAMLRLAGAEEAQARADADAIYALEAKIADFSLPKADMRDPNRIYNPRTAEELAGIAPNLDVSAYAAALGLSLEQPLVLHDQAWFEAADALVADTELAVLQAWLRWHLLSDMAYALPDVYGETSFAFYGQQVYGQAERKERWKRCTDATTRSLGDALGRHYVASNFAGDSKEIALTMVDGIKAAFTAGLPAIEWMDDETRAAAADKSGTLVEKIGYPDTWLDTSTMDIQVQPFAANSLAAQRFHVARDMAKVGQPVDPAEWFMPAPVVNAYYNPTENEMVFPAGILQPPFFHRSFNNAMNYGAIGMVIGHELTHGFDDEGRKFDKDGKLTEWWAADVSERFEERAQCVVDQYGGFEAVDGMFVNGELTTGENIADLGGVKLAWKAYKASLVADAPMVEGLSDDELFFVAYAQGWCSLMSPELEKLLVTSNPHSPPRFRVNGPLENTPEFHEVFECKAGQPMVRDPMCEVW